MSCPRSMLRLVNSLVGEKVRIPHTDFFNNYAVGKNGRITRVRANALKYLKIKRYDLISFKIQIDNGKEQYGHLQILLNENMLLNKELHKNLNKVIDRSCLNIPTHLTRTSLEIRS